MNANAYITKDGKAVFANAVIKGDVVATRYLTGAELNVSRIDHTGAYLYSKGTQMNVTIDTSALHEGDIIRIIVERGTPRTHKDAFALAQSYPPRLYIRRNWWLTVDDRDPDDPHTTQLSSIYDFIPTNGYINVQTESLRTPIYGPSSQIVTEYELNKYSDQLRVPNLLVSTYKATEVTLNKYNSFIMCDGFVTFVYWGGRLILQSMATDQSFWKMFTPFVPTQREQWNNMRLTAWQYSTISWAFYRGSLLRYLVGSSSSLG